MKRAAICAICVLFLFAACDGASDEGSSIPESTKVASSSSAPGGDKPFDRLTIVLELESNRVEPGGTIRSTISVENESDRPVTDPGCLLNSYSFAMLPADEPDGELWQQVVVDCSGASTMGPGFSDGFTGPDFQAQTKFGDPLPPGEYLATMALPKRTGRFAVPVTITSE